MLPATHDAVLMKAERSRHGGPPIGAARQGRLEKAGLVETYTNDEGKVAYRLTPKGAQLGRSLALAGDEDAAVVLDDAS